MGGRVDEATGSSRPRPISPAPFLAHVHRRWLVEGNGARWRRRPASLVAARIDGVAAWWDRLLADGLTAQELADALDAAMGRVLDAAAVHGGDLLAHGGGCLLLAFDGPGHERRGTQAASALPAGLRGLPGDTGVAPLDISLGVATGELDLFLVGGDHRELVVCGPLVSGVVALRQRARAGDVLADTTTAAAVNDARWSALGCGGHALVIPPPPSTVGLGMEPTDLSDAAVDLRIGIPVDLRRHLGAGTTGSPRTVAMAVVEVLGVDDLLAARGHEAVADALHAVVCAAQDACARHRTGFGATQGGPNSVRLSLTAGAPDSGVDDVGRLLLAARAVTAVECGLPIRAGVSQGRAVVTEVGCSRRRFSTVLGAVESVAGCLAVRAEAGSVIATDSALLAARIRFAATNLEPFEVPGEAEPALASLVGPPLDPGVAGVSRRPLIGRDEERDLVLAALEDVRNGTPRTVIVTGPTGIGRSRLLAEVSDAAPELPRLVACGGDDAGGPFADLWAGLRHLIGVAPDADDGTVAEALLALGGPAAKPWLPLLALPFGVTLVDTTTSAAVEPRSRRACIHALTARLLRPVLATRAVVVIDDADRLGGPSAALVHDLLGELAGRPWLVVMSAQDEDGVAVQADGPVTRIALGPLTPDAATALLHASARRPVRPDVTATAVNRAEGNPLFLEELLAWLPTARTPHDPPVTLEAAIEARLARLDDATRLQLQAAGLIGALAPMRLLTGLAPDSAANPVADLVEADRRGWVRFRHPVVRDVALQGLSAHRRRKVHGRLAELLEGGAISIQGRAVLLSDHTTAARRWEAACRWSEIAAASASAAGAPAEAARFLQRAVRAARQLVVPAERLSELYERLAGAEGDAGHHDEAVRALAQARRLAADDRPRVAQLLGQQGGLCEDAGDHAAARRWFRRGIQALDAGTPTSASELVRVDLMVGLARTCARLDRIGEAVNLLEEAVVDADALGHRQAATAGRELLAELQPEVRPTR